MSGKLLKHAPVFLLLFVCSLYTKTALAQTTFEQSVNRKLDSLLAANGTVSLRKQFELYPNDAMNGIMTPSGWGGYGTAVFGAIGGTYPEQYRDNKADLIASGGVCFGNPQKVVNFAASVNMTDVHNFRNFSGNFIVSRMIFTGSSISAGALQVFASKKYSDAANPTFFFAFSHAVQWANSPTPGVSALSYTLGIGNGRFLDKSPDDIKAGKGKYATAVFGSVSYEILRHVNLNGEWYGQNLGFSLTMRPFSNPLSFGVGAANLTGYSGDRKTMVFTIGYPLSLTNLNSRNKQQ